MARKRRNSNRNTQAVSGENESQIIAPTETGKGGVNSMASQNPPHTSRKSQILRTYTPRWILAQFLPDADCATQRHASAYCR